MGSPSLPQSVRVVAPAKLNPLLHVLGKREDGYHDLDMWMVTIDLLDELEVRRLDGGEAQASSELSLVVEELAPGAAEGCPAGESNLAWRAARLGLDRARELGLPVAPLALHLGKRIPSQAGLGGGSADAAAALFATALVLGLDPDDPVLAAGLAQLGSDCCFFLSARASGAARCRGRGELVEPVELPAARPHVVLVTPELRASTPAVYAALRGQTPDRDSVLPSLTELCDLDATPFCGLEAAALDVIEGLRGWRELLDDATRTVREELKGEGGGTFCLCGSGSSFFAFAPNKLFAERLLETLCVAAKARDYGLRQACLHTLLGAGVGLQFRK